MSTTIYGASDDLIEVDGDVREEFNVFGEDDSYLGFSNGVVLRVTYDRDGIWRIRPMAGLSRVTVAMAPTDDEDNYSDRAVIGEAVTWVVRGPDYARSRSQT